MSCDVAAAGMLWLAAVSGHATSADVGSGAAASAADALRALPSEPLYADIVRRAGRLEAEVEALRRRPGPPSAAFEADGQALADLDLQAHFDLARRGTDGDLKCILKGISQDLPRKFAALRSAEEGQGRRAALDELFYLLRDNVEVITAPPAPPV